MVVTSPFEDSACGTLLLASLVPAFLSAFDSLTLNLCTFVNIGEDNKWLMCCLPTVPHVLCVLCIRFLQILLRLFLIVLKIEVYIQM